MELTLSVLARVRTLFATGASIEEVYETLTGTTPEAEGLNDSLAQARQAATPSGDVDTLAHEVARLATMVEQLKGSSGPIAESQPPAPAPQETSPPPAPAEGPERAQSPDAAQRATDQRATETQAFAQALSAAPAREPAQHSPAPSTKEEDDIGLNGLDLRDQIAVAVTRISMLMGDDDRRPAGRSQEKSRQAG